MVDDALWWAALVIVLFLSLALAVLGPVDRDELDGPGTIPIPNPKVSIQP